MPHRLPLHMFIGFQTEIHVKHRASPQAELQPGRFPTRRITTISTSRITTREPTYCPQAELRPGSWLAGWLAGWGDYDQETYHALGWLGMAGWLRPREAQRGPERRSVDRTSLSCAWHTYKHTYLLPSQQPRRSQAKRPQPSQQRRPKRQWTWLGGRPKYEKSC